MITLLLCSEKVLNEPLLYLSLYFKMHRQRYYALLDEVRSTGDWESWLDFFADAVITTATQAVETAQQLMALSAADGQRINSLKRISWSAHLIHKALLERPMASPNRIQEKTQLSPATVNACLRELEKLGIVEEVTGQKRNRLYSYAEYLRIMNQGTELPE
jgi:Fic family protein